MTEQQILEALATLDPKLEPWQKCRHQWEDAGVDQRDRRFLYYCKKCKTGAASTNEAMAALFGDGKPCYQTVDVLLALCERLGLRKILGDDVPPYLTKYVAQVWVRGQERPLIHEVCDDNPVIALRQAILRVMEAWKE